MNNFCVQADGANAGVGRRQDNMSVHQRQQNATGLFEPQTHASAVFVTRFFATVFSLCQSKGVSYAILVVRSNPTKHDNEHTSTKKGWHEFRVGRGKTWPIIKYRHEITRTGNKRM
jgi:hypothetical protein